MNEPSVPQTWPAERWPTAEEWRHWFLQLTREEQLERAGRLIDDAQTAYRCFVADHEAAVERVQGEGRRILQAMGRAWEEGYRRGMLDELSDLDPADNPYGGTP